MSQVVEESYIPKKDSTKIRALKVGEKSWKRRGKKAPRAFVWGACLCIVASAGFAGGGYQLFPRDNGMAILLGLISLFLLICSFSFFLAAHAEKKPTTL